MQKAMSALPPKADMCSAHADVHFVPEEHPSLNAHNELSAIRPRDVFMSFTCCNTCSRL